MLELESRASFLLKGTFIKFLQLEPQRNVFTQPSMGHNAWEITAYLFALQFELKVVQEEFRDAMTENAALEGEVSQLTYEVRSLYKYDDIFHSS